MSNENKFPLKETTIAKQKKMDVLKGEEGKRVASGARHFRPTSGERLCRVP